MLEYYLPGLDASTLSENAFVQKLAHLNVLRKMEQHSQVEENLKKMFGE